MKGSFRTLMLAFVMLFSAPVFGEEVKSEPVGELTVDRVVTRPAPGLSSPRKLRFHPDGKRVTFLKPRPDSLVQDLWEYDLGSGQARLLFGAEALGGGAVEGSLSLEEELRRARLRELAEGLTDYTWAQDGETLLLPVRGDLFVWKEGGEIQRVTETPSPEMDARLSADGKRLFFVRNGQVFTMTAPFQAGSEKAVTPNPETGTSYGVAEYIAQEEFGRMTGYWLSPSGEQLVFTHVDERHVTEFPIVHQGGNPWGAPAMETHRYPFAGEKNADVTLFVGGTDGQQPEKVSIEGFSDSYLLDVQWKSEKEGFLVALMTREQQEYQVWDVTPGGESSLLINERSSAWIDRPGPLNFLLGAKGEIRGYLRIDASTGTRRIRTYDAAGKPGDFLTGPVGHVDSILYLDDSDQTLVFEGHDGDALERHIFRVSLQGGELTSLSGERGWHHGVFHPDGQRFIHYSSSLSRPLEVCVRDGAGTLMATIHTPDVKDWESLGLIEPELFEVKASDGAVMHGFLYRPEGNPPSGGWPVILAPYGGPTHQVVRDTWSNTVNLRRQYLAKQGFLVLSLDNRGTPRRDAAFSKAHYLRLGTVEVEDQVAAAQALVKRAGANPDKIAIMGWSYGGYLAALSLAKAPETFAAAVVGAPVVDWRGYDTGYTERYMGTPQTNEAGYTDSSVLTHLAQIEGRALIIHGMIDENVHFRHSASLIEGLLREGKHHDVMVYPEARHSPRRKSEKRFVFEKMVDWLKDALGVERPSRR